MGGRRLGKQQLEQWRLHLGQHRRLAAGVQPRGHLDRHVHLRGLHGDGFNWQIQNGGTAIGTLSSSGQTVDVVNQTRSFTAPNFTVADVSDSNGAATCTTPGHYTIRFGADRDSFDMTQLDDACSSRGDCIAGLHVTHVVNDQPASARSF